MSTSNTYSYNDVLNTIIRQAWLLVKDIDIQDGAVPNAEYLLGVDVLNQLLKAWEAQDQQLWNKKEATLFTNLNQNIYHLGPTGDYCAQSYVNNKSTATALINATTIVLSTVTGLTIGDNIGIVLDAGSRFWTTIQNINSGTLTVTLAAGLPSQASSGNNVVSFTSVSTALVGQIQRPINVIGARRYDLLTNTETLMYQVGYDEYMSYPEKLTVGVPTTFNYNKQTNNGVLYVYQCSQVVTTVINITYQSPIMDFTNPTDIGDFPTEWLKAVILNLACDLAPYGTVTADDYQLLKSQADAAMHAATYFNSSDTGMIVKRSTNRIRR